MRLPRYRSSLERHLLAWILGALGLGALLLLLAAYLVTLDEMGEVFDNNLKQVALAVASHSDAAGGPPAASAPRSLPKVFEEGGDFDFVTAVWDGAGHRRFLSDPSVVLPSTKVAGLSRLGQGDEVWHVYTIIGSDRVVQAAQRATSRRELAAEAAFKLLVPMLLLTFFIGAMLVFALRRGLRPLDRATANVAARSAVSLDPIDVAGVPREIHPLILSINGLMHRLAVAFSTQRQFVADAAHELRSPVTALRLQLQLLERASEDASRRVAIAELKLGVERAQRLIGQLLDLSRVEPDAPAQPLEPVDLSALVRAVVLKRGLEAEHRGVDLGAVAEVPVSALADPPKLSVLLDNLVGNAIRYTPPGGRVDVHVGRLDGRSDGRPMLQVIDTGPGIPEAERERVFDRFHRGEDAPSLGDGTGSGLGLAIVRAIAERHGAEVSLHAGPAGKGLEARVVFRA